MTKPATKGRGRAPLAGALLSFILLAAAASPQTSHSSSVPITLPPALQQAFEQGDIQRFIVMLKEQPQQTAAPIGSSDAARQALYGAQTAFAAEHQVGVRALIGDAVAQGVASDPTYLWIVNAVVVTGTESLAQTLANRSDVAAVLPNEKMHVEQVSTAPAASPEWNLDRVQAPDAWEQGVTGAGAVVGTIDTGVQWDHPALKRQYRGWNGTSANHNYNWADFHSEVPSPAPFDDYAHGTHVTGIMVGDDGGANEVGVAPGAKWIAAKACDADGNCFSDEILEAMQWMEAPTDLAGNNPDPTRAPDVVVMSVGSECANDEYLELYRSALQSWRAAGIVGVFSGGNQSFVPKPACYPEAVAVGVTDGNDNVPSWSGHGPSTYGEIKPDLVAPGVGIRSAIPGNGYQYLSGASMAAPHVAGVAALLAGYSNVITDDAIEKLLIASADDKGESGPDNGYGAGIVDADAALHRITDDQVRPVVGTFAVRDRVNGSPTVSNETQVNVSVSASDDIVVSGYLLTNTPAPPAPTAAGWSTSPPTSYVLPAGAGTKTVYAWARDLAGNVSTAASATITLDPLPPTTTLAVPSMTKSLNVGVKVAASDNVGVAAYMVSPFPTKPGESDPRWQSQAPSAVRVPSGDGVKRVYGWTKDVAGNVSAAAVSTTVLDTLAPSLAFSIPQITTSTTVPVTFSVSDASGVVGYYVSEDWHQPAATTPAWSSARPGSFALSNREGAHTVYAWALDGTGNVSRRASASVFVDSRAPRPVVQAPRSGGRVTALRLIRGLLGDPAPSSGVASVRWALVRGEDCAWYDESAEAMLPGTCGSPVWNDAKIAGRTWYATLEPLKDAGTYTLYVLAADRAGNSLTSSGIPGTSAAFTIVPARDRGYRNRD